MTVTKEKWAPALGYAGLYEVSDRGRVWSVRKGIVMRPQPHPRGYARLNLAPAHGKRRNVLVHRLVLEAFRGRKIPRRRHVNHKNGKKTDNRLANLEVVTPRQNSYHARAKGLLRTKLSIRQVRAIRERAGRGVAVAVLARRYKVTADSIRQAVKGRTWGPTPTKPRLS